MTIRKTLLVAFLCVGLLPAALLASLAFIKSRDVVRVEITRNLNIQAEGVAAYIDKLMFERLLNAISWSRLGTMQNMQGRDKDKKLSLFLADLYSGYKDFYLGFSCVDKDGQIVSSNDAAQIGSQVESQPVWLDATLSGVKVELESPTKEGDGSLIMRAPLNATSTGKALGQLRLAFDWTELYDVLDQAGRSGSRELVVLDRDGRLIAATKNLRERGLFLGHSFADWRNPAAGKIAEVRSGAPIFDTDVIVGEATSRGYEKFTGFGWTTLIIQPVDLALKPVHRMAAFVFGLLALISVLTFPVASWVSRRIARPITALTRFSRDYRRNNVLQVPPTVNGGEVGELTQSFVQMVRDIDLSRQNLVRASKLAVVGEMSSVIAHEVRTPLGILRSSAQMLKREPSISDEGRELLGFIESETERLNRLVSAMLDTARPRAPSYGDVDLHTVIEKSVAMLGGQVQKKGVVVAQSLLARDPVIECDEEQMTQVLLNLLMNGLQILGHGGRIEIVTSDDVQNIILEIADDGPGIQPEERSRIFEAFFFKREGGIGLGLAIVQQILVSHGGDIEASESKLGGALFRIRLPRKQSGEA